MDNLDYFIEMCLGVTIFIMALTISFILYYSMNDAIENSLTVNNISSDIIVKDQSAIPYFEYKVYYSSAQAYMIMRELIEYVDDYDLGLADEFSAYRELVLNTNNDINVLSVVEFVYLNGTSKDVSLNDLKNLDANTYSFKNNFNLNCKYEIQYDYSYSPNVKLNVSNHYITKITFVEVAK